MSAPTPCLPPFAWATFDVTRQVDGPWTIALLAGGMMAALTLPAVRWFSLKEKPRARTPETRPLQRLRPHGLRAPRRLARAA